VTRILWAVVMVALAVPAAAQTPLRDAGARAVAAEAAQYASIRTEPPLVNKQLFWTGIVLGAAAVAVAILAVTSEQRSDLSGEYRSVRLGVDLAPCGTDPQTTVRPVAECEANEPMLWVAGGMAAASTALIVYGGGRDYTGYPSAGPRVRWRVRF